MKAWCKLTRASSDRCPLTSHVTTMQTAFQQILAELHKLHAQINLRLPASQRVMQQQLLDLGQIQQRLKTLQIEVVERSRTCLTASTYLTYLTMTQLTNILIQDVTSLKHLAEEYPIDPEGAIACLQSMPKHSPDLLARLNPAYETHKQFLTNFLKKSSPLHKIQPVFARHG